MSKRFEGIRSNEYKDIGDLIKKVREYCKTDKDLSQCKWSITRDTGGYTPTIDIKLLQAPKDPFSEHYNNRYKEQGCKYGVRSVNHYHTGNDKDLSEYGKNIWCKIINFTMSFNWDDSDIMTDYFCTNFYMSCQIGRYEKPFEIIDKTDNEKKKVKTDIPEGLNYLNYSDSSFVIFGKKTKEMKEILKDLGGSFNSRLSCGCGWVFAKKHEESVRLMLGI